MCLYWFSACNAQTKGANSYCHAYLLRSKYYSYATAAFCVVVSVCIGACNNAAKPRVSGRWVLFFFALLVFLVLPLCGLYIACIPVLLALYSSLSLLDL